MPRDNRDWSRIFDGTTAVELQPLRDVPRASTPLSAGPRMRGPRLARDTFAPLDPSVYASLDAKARRRSDPTPIPTRTVRADAKARRGDPTPVPTRSAGTR